MAEFSRNEMILKALLNGDTSALHHVPQSRNEALLLAMGRKFLGMESLSDIPLGGNVIDAVGIPDYISDVSQYSAYGLTDTGWYVFGRIPARPGQSVTAQTEVTGADGYIATVGADHVDVAVRFEVAAMSRVVTVDWDGENTDTYVFRATDLAIRNLDYRTTFYVYDVAPFATWTYGLTADATFAADKKYYTLSGDTYALAEVTATDPVPAYYTEDGGTYTQATSTFEDGVTYYTKSGDVYSEATVTVGDPIPAYYNHTKVTFEGMTKNITYRFDEEIDCPSEFILPEIDDDEHGCWFEFRFIHSGSFSSTLVPPSSDVKVATEHTQAESKGINMVDLHYTSIGGVKCWRFMNTHSTLPTS